MGGRMRDELKAIGIVLLATLALLGTIYVGVAWAHSSDYCGHRESGVYNTTTMHAHRDGYWGHRHLYRHKTHWGFRHSHWEWKWCKYRGWCDHPRVGHRNGTQGCVAYR